MNSVGTTAVALSPANRYPNTKNSPAADTVTVSKVGTIIAINIALFVSAAIRCDRAISIIFAARYEVLNM